MRHIHRPYSDGDRNNNNRTGQCVWQQMDMIREMSRVRERENAKNRAILSVLGVFLVVAQLMNTVLNFVKRIGD